MARAQYPRLIQKHDGNSNQQPDAYPDSILPGLFLPWMSSCAITDAICYSSQTCWAKLSRPTHVWAVGHCSSAPGNRLANLIIGLDW
jgi:hypothetical protein